MKRVFKQKNEPVLSRSVKSSESLTQLPNHRLNVAAATSNEGPRRTRTSAAMLGLAISVSATGMLLPGRSHKAVAAEPMVNEHNFENKSLEKQSKVSSAPKAQTKVDSAVLIKEKQQVKPSVSTPQVKQVKPSASSSVVPSTPRVSQSRIKTSSPPPKVASPRKQTIKTPSTKKTVVPTPQSNHRQPSSSTARAHPKVVQYQVEPGDTLWRLSQKHGIKPEDIATSSNISTNAILSIGQSLQIPSSTAQDQNSKIAGIGDLTKLINSPTSQDSIITGNINKIAKDQDQLNSTPSSLQSDLGAINRNITKLPSLKQGSLSGANFNTTSLGNEELASSDGNHKSEQSPSVIIPVPLPQTINFGSISEASANGNDIGKSVAIPLQVRATGSGESSPQQVLELAIPTYKPAKAQSVGQIAQPTPIVLVSEPTQPQSYQVQSGDTLNEIASRYGVSRSELIQVNGLTNPDLISINQQIKIPKAQSTNQLITTDFSDSSLLLASSNAIPEQLKVENSQVANSVDSTEVVSTNTTNIDDRLTQEIEANSQELNSSVIISNLPLQQTANTDYDPHIERLKADILRMREEYRRQNQEEDEEAAMVTVPIAPSLNNAVSIPVPVQSVNPEWQPDSQNQSSDQGLNTTNQARGSINIPVELRENIPSPTDSANIPVGQESNQQQLVATAPMPVESYNGLINTPVGEVVSPELPPLQAPDQYLPNSPDSFNGYVWPAKGVLTSGYGWRWGRMHKGIDIAAPVGTPIYAVAPGEVISSGWNSGGYGNLVKIRHPDGSVTLYAHNSRLNVRRGQQVTQGQKIAEMGSTGYSTGPHLHFEVHPQGSGAANPIAYLPSR